MKARKLAALGTFFAGAALTFAPLASADDLTAIVDSEISSLNSIFEAEAAVAGVSADVVSSPGLLDTISLADAPDTTPLTTLDYELYGPFVGILDLSSFDATPGAQDLFNGALVEFDDAYTTFAAFFEGTDPIPATDLLGLADIALDDGTISDVTLFGNFLDTGVADLLTWVAAL